MTFGPKYKIIYDGNQVVGKKEMPSAAAVALAKIPKPATPPKTPIPPAPAGHSRGYAVATNMIRNGEKNKAVIFQTIYHFYKANTNRTERKIMKDCGKLIAQLEKEKIL